MPGTNCKGRLVEEYVWAKVRAGSTGAELWSTSCVSVALSVIFMVQLTLGYQLTRVMKDACLTTCLCSP